MSFEKRKMHAKADAKRKQRSSGFGSKQRSNADASVLWADIHPQAFSQLVQRSAEAGALIQFGLTSDRGAIMLGVMHADERIKDYCASTDELREKLGELDELLDEFGATTERTHDFDALKCTCANMYEGS